MARKYVDTMEELFAKHIKVLKRNIELTTHSMEISRKKKQNYITEMKNKHEIETIQETNILQKVKVMPDDIIRVIASYLFTPTMKICLKQLKFENLEEVFKQIYSNHASIFTCRFTSKTGDIVSRMISQMPVLSTYRSTRYISRNHNKKSFITIFKREMDNLQQLRNALDRMNVSNYKAQLEEHIIKTYNLLDYLLKNFSISKKRRDNRQAKLLAMSQSITENT